MSRSNHNDPPTSINSRKNSRNTSRSGSIGVHFGCSRPPSPMIAPNTAPPVPSPNITPRHSGQAESLVAVMGGGGGDTAIAIPLDTPPPPIRVGVEEGQTEMDYSVRSGGDIASEGGGGGGFAALPESTIRAIQKGEEENKKKKGKGEEDVEVKPKRTIQEGSRKHRKQTSVAPPPPPHPSTSTSSTSTSDERSSSVAAAVSAQFSQVELFFQLEADKGRTALFPRDVADLLLWVVPTSVPLIEGPKAYFVKNKSKVKHVLLIAVEGWTYDMLMCTGVGLPRKIGGGEEEDKASTPSTSSTCAPLASVVWNEALCSALLRPIREQRCWARESCAVQYAPVVIPHPNPSMAAQFFWRQQQADSSAGKPSVSTSSSSQELGSGTGSTFRHALQGSKKKPNATTTTTPPLAPMSADTETQSTTTTTNTTTTVVEGVATPSPLWDDEKLLLQYALTMERDASELDALSFPLEIPKNKPPGKTMWWDAFEPRSNNSNSNNNSTNNNTHVVAFDCEMVQIANGVSALARATLVDARTGETLLDILVKPEEEIVDYVTRFSGIREEMLRDVTTTLRDCQSALKAIIKTDTFVVGHGLDNDFIACQMLPTCRVLDTTHLFPHPSELPYKNSLKFLALRYLKKKIQQGEHDSATDAMTSAELVLLKLEKGPDFGVRRRVNIVDMISNGLHTQGQKGNGQTSSSSSSINLIDDALVLRDIAPSSSSSGVNLIPARDDRDAVKKAVRCMKRVETSQNRFGMTWVQLHQTALDVTAVENPINKDNKDEMVEEEEPSSTSEWEDQVFTLHRTNRNVLQLIEAAPSNSVIVILSGACRADSESLPTTASSSNTHRINNLFSRAQGMCFAFIKDNEHGKPPAEEWMMDCDVEKSTNQDAEKDEKNENEITGIGNRNEQSHPTLGKRKRTSNNNSNSSNNNNNSTGVEKAQEDKDKDDEKDTEEEHLHRHQVLKRRRKEHARHLLLSGGRKNENHSNHNNNNNETDSSSSSSSGKRRKIKGVEGEQGEKSSLASEAVPLPPACTSQ